MINEQNHFNPRTHEECDIAPTDYNDVKWISIHALTRSATKSCVPALTVVAISIHALTRSATWVGFIYQSLSNYFNPRTHEECDESFLREYLYLLLFQSTHSRGVRHQTLSDQMPMDKFQSTHSRGVRPRLYSLLPYSIQFQSTHSRGVRRAVTVGSTSKVEFQSTHSRGVRQRLQKRMGVPSRFQSTHSRGVRHHRAERRRAA